MPDQDYASASVRFRRIIIAATAAMVALVVTGVLLMLAVPELPSWVGPTLAGIALIPLVVSLAGAARFALRHEGVEQVVYLRSTTFSFVATMLACAGYGLLEAFANAPAVSAWWFYLVGVTASLGSSFVFQRRIA